MENITRDTVIADILDIAPESAPLFMSIGMHCLGCAMANGETLGEACEVHGVDTEEFLAKLTSSLRQ
jgi:hybrid cluster-associated redox disulfide protein